MSPACSVETVEDLRAEVEVDAKWAPPGGCSYKRTIKEKDGRVCVERERWKIWEWTVWKKRKIRAWRYIGWREGWDENKKWVSMGRKNSTFINCSSTDTRQSCWLIRGWLSAFPVAERRASNQPITKQFTKPCPLYTEPDCSHHALRNRHT